MKDQEKVDNDSKLRDYERLKIDIRKITKVLKLNIKAIGMQMKDHYY